MVKVVLLFSFALLSFPVWAASAKDIDTMTTLAVMYGRSIGCGSDTNRAGQEIGAWLDRHFPNGSEDKKTYFPIFLLGVKQNAQNQHNGKSPDSCSKVSEFFSSSEYKRTISK